ncbi:hornerin-like [Iris pallida]|uniref:Hornerin-like n=1 Tax=Iris pallida TaxID=29817 RepID=A0AAX6HIH2_IRIPA|nr:hornerin-like [Iris pallida]
MLLAAARGMESPVDARRGRGRGRGRGRRKLFAKAGSTAALLDESGFWDPAEMALTRGVAPASRRGGSAAQRRRQRTRAAGKRAWPDLPCWDSRTPAWVSIGHGRTRLEQRSGIRWCPVMGRALTRWHWARRSPGHCWGLGTPAMQRREWGTTTVARRRRLEARPTVGDDRDDGESTALGGQSLD